MAKVEQRHMDAVPQLAVGASTEVERRKHIAQAIADAEERGKKQAGALVVHSLMPVNILTNRVPFRYLDLIEEWVSEMFALTGDDIQETFACEAAQRERRDELRRQAKHTEAQLQDALRERDELRSYAEDCRASEVEARKNEIKVKGQFWQAASLLRVSVGECTSPCSTHEPGASELCLSCRIRAYLEKQGML